MDLLEERIATTAAAPPREAARRTLAMRIAHRNRLRAERLGRLRAGDGAAASSAPPSASQTPPQPAPAPTVMSAPPVTAIPPAPEAAEVDAGAALEEFLRALTGEGDVPASAPEPGDDDPEMPDEPSPAAVLHFQRPGAAGAAAGPAAPGFAEAAGGQLAASDLALLPGMGPSLIWAFRRAGIPSLAALAGLDEPGLVARLGPLGRLVPAGPWLARARAATGP